MTNINIDNVILENINIDDVILENIDIDKAILENINIDTDIDKDNPENIDIGIKKVSVRPFLKILIWISIRTLLKILR